MIAEFDTEPTPLSHGGKFNLKRIARIINSGEEYLVIARVVQPDLLSVHFAIFCDPDDFIDDIMGVDEGADLEGWIKWDGCSNWMTPENYWHACGRDGLLEMGALMTLCYDWTKELIDPKDMP